MIACVKCGKEYSEEFHFCPYCGKKKDVKALDSKNSVTMAMFLAFCGDDDFSERLEEARRKGELETPEKIALFLRRPIEPVTVWAIGTETRHPFNNTVGIREGNISVSGLRHNKKMGWLNHAWPVEKTLLKSYLGKIGILYFWTKEECQQAIDGVLKPKEKGE